MIIPAAWQAWPGFEAFFVTPEIEGAPCYLIQLDRKELARKLARGKPLEEIICEGA